MTAGDEAFNLTFVLEQERVDVLLVQHAGSLGLGENEVAEEEQAEPAVEGDPILVILLAFFFHAGGRERVIACGWHMGGGMTYQPRMKTVHDSASRTTDKTTQ